MNNQIDKKQAAELIGVHFKTLEHWIKKGHLDIDMPVNTGYHKTSAGRVFFDVTLFTTWAKKNSFEVKETIIEGEFEPVPEPNTSMVKAPRRTPAKVPEAPAAAPVTPQIGGLEKVFLRSKILNDFYLTIDEAHDLTGLTKAFLSSHSDLVGGRRMIKKSKLEEI
jgi:hypothetical protein